MTALLLSIDLMLARIRGPRTTDDRGASLVEYALLLALIAIVCFVAVEYLGGTTSTEYSDIGNSLPD